MKTKSKYIFFSLFASLILLALHSMYIIGIAYTQNKPENLLWSLPLLIISISVIFCVFVFKPAIDKIWSSWPEKINGDKIGNPNNKVMSHEELLAKKSEYKWSNLMGHCTWERTKEIIKKKGKSWRLPTYNELCEFHYDGRFGQAEYLEFWSPQEGFTNQDVLNAKHNKSIKPRPPHAKAKFILVREV